MDLYISECLFDAEAVWAQLFSAVAKFPGYAAAVSGVYLLIVGAVKKRNGGFKTAVYLLSGVCLTVILTLILKEVTGRTRFADLNSAEEFYPGAAFGSGGDSFPSGHTAMAACGFLFSPLIRRRGARRAFNAAVSVWVALTAAARVVTGAHYFTDTVAAAALAVLIKAVSGYLILDDGYLKLINALKSKFASKRRSV